MKHFNIDSELIYASKMNVDGKKSDLILSICRESKADSYYSGISGKDYIDKESFAEAGIGLSFQEFYHPIYKQLFEPFSPCMCALDLLFNYGPDSSDAILGKGVEVMDKLFL
jgi:hypothetical protein